LAQRLILLHRLPAGALGRQPCRRLSVEPSGNSPWRADAEVDGTAVGFEQTADFVPLLGGGKRKRQEARRSIGWALSAIEGWLENTFVRQHVEHVTKNGGETQFLDSAVLGAAAMAMLDRLNGLAADGGVAIANVSCPDGNVDPRERRQQAPGQHP
jgi:hypothetical protein